MKKNLLLITFIVIGNFALAQCHYGLIAGPNFSELGPGSSDYSFSLKTGFYGGVWAEYSLCHKFDIQPELLYSGQGFNATYTGARAFSSSTINGVMYSGTENYLDLPILARYNCHQGFYTMAGPQIGLLLSASSGGVNVKSDYTSTDFSGVLGIGYISKYNVGIQLKYNYGFTGIEKDYSGGGEPNFKNRVFQVGFSYKVK